MNRLGRYQGWLRVLKQERLKFLIGHLDSTRFDGRSINFTSFLQYGKWPWVSDVAFLTFPPISLPLPPYINCTGPIRFKVICVFTVLSCLDARWILTKQSWSFKLDIGRICLECAFIVGKIAFRIAIITPIYKFGVLSQAIALSFCLTCLLRLFLLQIFLQNIELFLVYIQLALTI